MNFRLPFAIIGLALPLAALPDTLWIGRFSETDSAIPSPWKVERLSPDVAPTRYRLRHWDGVNAVEAAADSSMALLGRPLMVDLEKSPILCWHWRVDAALKSADMRTKAGDDYAARVYLTFVIPPDQLGIGTRTKLALARSIYGKQMPDAAINYVWDNRQPLETLMNNAYTDRARMIVVRSGDADAGHWVSERRDVLADFRRAFGPLTGRLTGIAIAVDTDNTKERAHAGFADFRFVSSGQPCANE
jgi:hypothetical protein